jgi:hypothetical protein
MTASARSDFLVDSACVDRFGGGWLVRLIHCVHLNVEPAVTAFQDYSERTTGNWVGHCAEHSRRIPLGGFRVTWDVLYLKISHHLNIHLWALLPRFPFFWRKTCGRSVSSFVWSLPHNWPTFQPVDKFSWNLFSCYAFEVSAIFVLFISPPTVKLTWRLFEVLRQ